MLGEGHPDQKSGPAPLPATPYPRRLMCGNPKLRYMDGSARLTVKAEWDAAKAWFDEEIKDGRMDQ